MIHKIVTGFTLLAFINCLMGCNVHSPQRVLGQDSATISPREKITKLVLFDGTTVIFNDRGGSFDTKPHEVIKGISMRGDTISLPLGDIWLCRTSPPISLTPSELDSARIAEIVLNDNTVVMFDAQFARYDMKTRTIKGTLPPGGKGVYPVTELRSIRAKRPATTSLDDLKRQPEKRVYEVVTKMSNVFTFDSTGGHIAYLGGFYGKTVDGTYVDVPVENVLSASVERTDPGLTVVATLGVIVAFFGALALLAMATKQCCPFIYTFDGQRFVFDAEPLGGSICPGFSRTDISRLDFAKPVDDEYRLLVRNEVPETQYIDRMKLLLLDHPPEMAIYPDLQGRFYAFRNVLGARSAFDERGMSLMKFLRTSDGIAWQTHLPTASRDSGGPLRHEITVMLPKPAGAQKAWLVTNIGTSSWGSNMIRKTVEYRGSSAHTWLASLTTGSQAALELDQFLQREEMYHLKTWVREGDSWNPRALILGQGPLISEDRVYSIDISNASGDSLVLRFNPPKGFWTFDYLGVSYEEPTVITPMQINAHRAEDQRGISLLGALGSADNVYYTMPEVGDWATVSFSAPPMQKGTARSVYLQTSGYYELHLPKEMPGQFGRLSTIALNPGQIVRTAMEEFRTWQANQLVAY